VSHHLFGTGTKHQEVRENAVRVIISQKDDFLPFLQGETGRSDLTTSSYCKAMIRPDSWGGNAELLAISIYYNLKIKIYAMRRDTIDIGDGETVIRLWYSHGNHYECVYELSELNKMTFTQFIVTAIVSRALRQLSGHSSGEDQLEHFKRTGQYPNSYRNIDYLQWKGQIGMQEDADTRLAASMTRAEQDDHHRQRVQEEDDLRLSAKLHNEAMDEEYARRLQEEEDRKSYNRSRHPASSSNKSPRREEPFSDTVVCIDYQNGDFRTREELDANEYREKYQSDPAPLPTDRDARKGPSHFHKLSRLFHRKNKYSRTTN